LQALFNGHGTKYFRGKITSIDAGNGSFTFGITYDDGDKENGALPANVRRLGSSVRSTEVASTSAVDADGNLLAVGDAVEVCCHECRIDWRFV
jgi:hypothetical protein